MCTSECSQDESSPPETHLNLCWRRGSLAGPSAAAAVRRFPKSAGREEKQSGSKAINSTPAPLKVQCLPDWVCGQCPPGPPGRWQRLCAGWRRQCPGSPARPPAAPSPSACCWTGAPAVQKPYIKITIATTTINANCERTRCNLPRAGQANQAAARTRATQACWRRTAGRAQSSQTEACSPPLPAYSRTWDTQEHRKESEDKYKLMWLQGGTHGRCSLTSWGRQTENSALSSWQSRRSSWRRCLCPPGDTVWHV